jgi:hypothetical protein
MEKLGNRNAYPAETASHIESMGSLAVSIANRWMMGWPDRVEALLESNGYLNCLDTQVMEEKTILANEANLRHLSQHEIMQIYEIKASPRWPHSRKCGPGTYTYRLSCLYSWIQNSRASTKQSRI